MFIVGLYNFFYNRQSETGAFLVPAAGKIGFVKAFPDLVQILTGDTDTVILYRDIYFLVFDAHLNRNRRFIFAEFDCIINQVVKYLLDLPLISVDNDRSRHQKQLHGNVFRSAYRLE